MSIATMPQHTQDGRRQDFDEVFRQHSSMVYRTARAITGNAEDAEDVLQTIFLRLMRQEDAGQLRKNVKAYLYRAAVNLSLDLHRERQRRSFTHNIDDLETPVWTANSRFDDELHQRLNTALAELSPEAAQILVLRYVHDYSDAEISKLLGTSRGAIAVRLFRVRARLKKLLLGRQR
jgi:RNA polymerase sigma-70 factor (ECF subfamily)